MTPILRMPGSAEAPAAVKEETHRAQSAASLFMCPPSALAMLLDRDARGETPQKNVEPGPFDPGPTVVLDCYPSAYLMLRLTVPLPVSGEVPRTRVGRTASVVGSSFPV